MAGTQKTGPGPKARGSGGGGWVVIPAGGKVRGRTSSLPSLGPSHGPRQPDATPLPVISHLVPETHTLPFPYFGPCRPAARLVPRPSPWPAGSGAQGVRGVTPGLPGALATSGGCRLQREMGGPGRVSSLRRSGQARAHVETRSRVGVGLPSPVSRRLSNSGEGWLMTQAADIGSRIGRIGRGLGGLGRASGGAEGEEREEDHFPTLVDGRL